MDIVLVHEDMGITFAVVFACLYKQIPVGHVEKGVRTYSIRSSYPEDFNRQVVGIIVAYYFAQAERSRDNLVREGESGKYLDNRKYCN